MASASALPTPASLHAPLFIQKRLEKAFISASANNPRFICDVRALVNNSLESITHAFPDRNHWHPKNDHHPLVIQIGRVVAASPLKVDEWSKYILAGTIQSLSPKKRPVCDAVVIGMEAPDAATRMALIMDVGRLLSLTREQNSSPLLVMHGRAMREGCASPEKYVAQLWKSLPEECWLRERDRLRARHDLSSMPCAVDGSTRWCSGFLDTVTSCTQRPPLINVINVSTRQPAVRHSACGPPDARRHSVVFHGGYMRTRIFPTARYFSLLTDPNDLKSLVLLFKNHAHREMWVGGLTSKDGGRMFKGLQNGEPELVIPAWNGHWRAKMQNDHWGLPMAATLTHNYAALRLEDGSYVLVGGRHREPMKKYDGIWSAKGHSWRWNDNEPTSLKPKYQGLGVYLPLNISARMQWTELRRMIPGTHPGCVEARDVRTFPQLAGENVCEFDGRLSLAKLGGKYLLYARANRAAHGGQRSVQLTTSTDLIHWSPFEPLRIRGHDILSAAAGDLYFFLAVNNPVHNGSLIGLFPLVQHARGCIGMSLSIDGKEWSSVTPLMRCAVHGLRAEHQPVGLVLLPTPTRRGGYSSTSLSVGVFVHERVPGISYDEKTPYKLANTLERLERRQGATQLAIGAFITRYTLPCEYFARWTEEQLAELGHSGTVEYVCTPAPKCQS